MFVCTGAALVALVPMFIALVPMFIALVPMFVVTDHEFVCKTPVQIAILPLQRVK